MIESTSHDSNLKQMGNAREFISYYQEEMDRNISAIRKTIVTHSDQSDDPNAMELIVDAGNAISDLAMVYGFETEEAIGRTIAKTAGNGIRKSELEELISRLERSSKTVEDRVAEVQSAPDERPNAGRPAEEKVKAVDPNPPKGSHSGSDGVGLLFDIKDDGELMSFLQDEDELDLPLRHKSEAEITDEPGNETEQMSPDQEESFQEDSEGISNEDGIEAAIGGDGIGQNDIPEPPEIKIEDKEEKTLMRKISGFFGNKQ